MSRAGLTEFWMLGERLRKILHANITLLDMEASTLASALPFKLANFF